MSMDYIEMCPHEIFDMVYGIDERAAHIVDIVYKIVMPAVRCAVIMNSVDTLVLRLIMTAHTGEDMYLMPFAL